MTIKDLEAFFENGWNHHDVDTLMTEKQTQGGLRSWTRRPSITGQGYTVVTRWETFNDR